MGASWQGMLVATALPLRDDLTVDLQRYAAHVHWLADAGCAGVVPNGSLGEYQTLDAGERSAVVETAVRVAAERPTPFAVVPGVSAYGAGEAVRWAEQAAEAGCPAVMLLPPNAYRASEAAVVDHFRAVAAVGLPVVAYNNPIDTKIDLTPAVLARLHGDGLIVAVKEFTGDVRRAYEIAELAPGLDLVVGSDDVVLELALAGATGWIAGIPNALPRECLALWRAGTSACGAGQASGASEALAGQTSSACGAGQASGASEARAGRASPSGDLAAALPAYRALHPLLRWDARTEFVQAIKLAMDEVGRYGGPCRPPRTALGPATRETVRTAVRDAVRGAAGAGRAATAAPAG